MLDTVAQVQTPEGIALPLRTAGPMPRAIAWAVDAAIRIGVIWIVSIPILFVGRSGRGLYAIALFAVLWFYPVLFEVLRDGQTPGKRVMQLRVVNANGTPVTWLASFLRNLLRTVDMLPVFYGFGLVASLADARSRRLGDIVAGTLVVYADPPRKAVEVPMVPVVLPSHSLKLDERAAIVEFAERARQLTPERQEELANLLPALTDARGTLAVQRLFGIANGILGRR